ncbi:MAG TPA: hypothetical protein VGX50_00220 [Longimicrobium sp.]|nr:hypothetical protein [Longimicrobium sp.]
MKQSGFPPDPQALTQKDQLELQKLQCEIKELQSRLDERPGEMRRQIVQHVATIAAVLITAVGTVVTVNEFLDHQARQYEMVIDREILDLVDKIRSDSAREREIGTLLISAYETNAIPVLLWELKYTSEEEAAAVVDALRRVEAKRRVELDDVWKPLMKATRDVVAAEVNAAPATNAVPIVNHLKALAAFGDRRSRPLKAYLRELRTEVDRAEGNGRLDSSAHFMITQEIQRITRELDSR